MTQFDNMVCRCVMIVIVLAQIALCKRYRAHDKVDVISNTVGPYNNPTETYPVRFLNLVFINNLHVICCS